MRTVFIHCRVLFEASEAYAACDLADILTQTSQVVTPHSDILRLFTKAVVGGLDFNITVVVGDFQAGSEAQEFAVWRPTHVGCIFRRRLPSDSSSKIGTSTDSRAKIRTTFAVRERRQLVAECCPCTIPLFLNKYCH